MNADAIDALLPQTQCTRCGYSGCRPYAEAIGRGEAAINRCPPGGAATIAQLASLLGSEPLALDPDCGAEGPALLAVIDEARCIGCARCLPPCPVDAILGAPKQMHTVLAALCTGCELCVAPCPVDCITIVPRAEADSSAAATRGSAAVASRSPAPSPAANRQRYAARNTRIATRTQRRAALLAERKRLAGTAAEGGTTNAALLAAESPG